MSYVIVLAGGASDERDVSLRSGAAVTAALKTAGHKVKQLDPAQGLDKLLPDFSACDVVFPALHGEGGEDGSLQNFLETKKICYVGSDSQSSELCYYKNRYIELLAQRGYTVPQSALLDFEEFRDSELRKKPHVVKPNDGGSSIDTFIVRKPGSDDTNIEKAFARHGKLLVQNLVEGDEITVAILGEESLPVIEVIPPIDQEFDYTNKYNGATEELCPPKNIPQVIQENAQRQALEIHHLTSCSDMSRTDFIVGKEGVLYALETNTIPGLTDQSLLPKAAATAGYDMAALCDKLIQMAVARGPRPN